MKDYQLLGFLGVFFLAVFLFSPLAVVNNNIATIAPVFNNFTIADGFWKWLDISAFAVTLYIVVPLAAYFIFRGKKWGVIITASVSLISTLFILAALWITDVNTIGDKTLSFHFSWGWLPFLIGILAIYYSGSRMNKISI